MYKAAYASEVDASPGVAREREQRAFDHSIQLLEIAEAEGPETREAVEALYFARRLWSLLLEDLAREENELPDDLRANLISIGLWVIRECEEIRRGNSKSFAGIIEVSKLVRVGLK